MLFSREKRLKSSIVSQYNKYPKIFSDWGFTHDLYGTKEFDYHTNTRGT